MVEGIRIRNAAALQPISVDPNFRKMANRFANHHPLQSAQPGANEAA